MSRVMRTPLHMLRLRGRGAYHVFHEESLVLGHGGQDQLGVFFRHAAFFVQLHHFPDLRHASGGVRAEAG